MRIFKGEISAEEAHEETGISTVTINQALYYMTATSLDISYEGKDGTSKPLVDMVPDSKTAPLDDNAIVNSLINNVKMVFVDRAKSFRNGRSVKNAEKYNKLWESWIRMRMEDPQYSESNYIPISGVSQSTISREFKKRTDALKKVLKGELI